MTRKDVILEEVCDILNGYAFDSSKFSSTEGFPLIRIRDMKNSSCSLRYTGEFDEKYVVRKGDLLVGMDGEFDIYEWHGEPSLLNQRVCKLIPKPKELDKLYLLHRLKANLKAIEKETPSTTVKHISSNQILNIKWSTLPEYKEQKKIGLSVHQQLIEVQKARTAIEIINEDVKRLKYLTLQKFLCVFEEGERFALGGRAVTTSGSTPSRGQKNYWASADIPWIKTGEIAFAPITKSEEYVSSLALKECSLKLLPVNSVLIAMYGQGKTRGQSAILKVPATINQACFAILPNDTWEPEFLQLWLMYSYQELRNMSENRGGNQANLNGDLLNSFEVPAPPLEIQKEVVKKVYTALDEIDKLNNAWNTKFEDIKTLPNRLLDKAFNEIEYEQD